jgi:hypothetical protein
MTKEEIAAGAAKAIREAAEGVPETLAWALYDCADRVEREGIDRAAKSVVETVSLQFQVRDRTAWQGSKIVLLVNLLGSLR